MRSPQLIEGMKIRATKLSNCQKGRAGEINADPHGTTVAVHNSGDMKQGQEVLDLVRTAEEALEHLARSTGDGRAYDLAVCFWGDDLPHDAREPLAVELMRELRARGIRLPVIIFAEQHVFRNRKRQAIELGSLGCYYRWESLLRAIQMALDPESETT